MPEHEDTTIVVFGVGVVLLLVAVVGVVLTVVVGEVVVVAVVVGEVAVIRSSDILCLTIGDVTFLLVFLCYK